MRLPLVAFAVTLASSMVSFVGGATTAQAADKPAKAKTETKSDKAHPAKGKSHAVAHKLPPLPKHSLKHAENVAKTDLVQIAKPTKKADATDAKVEAKAEAKKPEAKADAKKSDNPYEDPPEELTGALPQKKIADKKKKADDKAKADDKKSDKSEKADAKAEKKKADEKKSEKADDDKKLILPHGGKPAKTSSLVTPENEFQTLHKKGPKSKPKTCLAPAISFARLGQPTDVTFSLTTCNGAAAPNAVENLSILARPYDVPPPSMEPTSALSLQKKAAKPNKALATTGSKEGKEEIAPGIRRIDSGMVSRLQRIADKFPGKTITLVSGYRPASKGSPHQAARAFDIRIDGVTNEALVAFCRTMPDTGCGYYPNSYFVHVDVRAAGAGHVYWIDVSGPGEKPTYVKKWPIVKPALPELKAATADTLPSESGEKPGDKPAESTEPSTQPTTDAAKIGPLEETDEDAKQ